MESNIFISSTCFDLIDMRSEIFTYLKEAGLVPIMSDQLDSDFQTFHDQNSIETCLINLRNADLVIIVLSQRYGPTLEKAGFSSVSATHLEYLEAIKENKRIIMFVRDRLEADFNIYLKTKDAKALTWVRDKDIKIFEIIEGHKRLVNTTNNNWYWTFKNSVEVKKRLDVELKVNISEVRLNNLIKSGNVPFVTIDVTVDYTLMHRSMKIKITAENLGNHPAIEPFIVLYAAESYEQVMEFEQNPELNIENLYNSISSLKPNDKSKPVEFEIAFNNQRQNLGTFPFIIEVIYKNSFGDNLTDITKVEVEAIQGEEYKYLEVSKWFIAKRLRAENIYQQIVRE
jgi:hypothetical protein